MCVDAIAAGELDSARGQIDGRHRRRLPIRIHAGRIASFSLIVVKVEFDGNAFPDSLITEPGGVCPQCRRSYVLDGEGKSIALRCGYLEFEVCRERLDIDRRIPEHTSGLIEATVCQLQPGI